MIRKLTDGVCAAAVGDEHDVAIIDVGDERDVVLTAFCGGLVDGDAFVAVMRESAWSTASLSIS